jgi:N-acetylmuramoyl-L-alanine amidase
LEERAAIANTHNADLFISIHANASELKSASGIETFCLNLVSDGAIIKHAATVNSTSPKNIAQLDMILNELMTSSKVYESGNLAVDIQKHLFNHLNGKYGRIKNRGVKNAPFYIFLATDMPSIMVQTGFITNRYECDRLQSKNYQTEISKGIVEGAKVYINERDATQPLNSTDAKGRAAD